MKLFYKKDLIESAISSNPNSTYLILACNINLDDKWIWKYCPKKHNFIPVFDNVQPSCVINRKELFGMIGKANEWLNGGSVHINRQLQILRLQ